MGIREKVVKRKWLWSRALEKKSKANTGKPILTEKKACLARWGIRKAKLLRLREYRDTAAGSVSAVSSERRLEKSAKTRCPRAFEVIPEPGFLAKKTERILRGELRWYEQVNTIKGSFRLWWDQGWGQKEDLELPTCTKYTASSTQTPGRCARVSVRNITEAHKHHNTAHVYCDHVPTPRITHGGSLVTARTSGKTRAVGRHWHEGHREGFLGRQQGQQGWQLDLGLGRGEKGRGKNWKNWRQDLD